MILRAGKGMNRLIKDLPDAARIEADQLILDREIQEPENLAREPVDLRAFLAARSSSPSASILRASYRPSRSTGTASSSP